MYPHEAADQAHTQGHHTYSREKGYQPADYKHQDYPKDLGGGVVVKSAEDEALYREKEKALAAKAKETAEKK